MLLIFLVYILGCSFAEKNMTSNDAFQQSVEQSNHKSSKPWANKGSKLWNRVMESFLQDNDFKI